MRRTEQRSWLQWWAGLWGNGLPNSEVGNNTELVGCKAVATKSGSEKALCSLSLQTGTYRTSPHPGGGHAEQFILHRPAAFSQRP